MIEGRPIEVFNEGRHTRDFTYVEDIVEGVVRATFVGDDESPAIEAALVRLLR